MRERSTIEGLERGVQGTKKTLEKMHKLVALGKLDPTMQRIATWIRLQVPQDRRASTTAVLDAIFWWVKKHGIFQRDPFQVEKIEHPIAAMQPIIEARESGAYKGRGLFVGDCDTIAGVYLATLGGVLGFHYAWETAKVDVDRPDEFSHVWVAFRTNGDWYPLDPSTKDVRPGWRPPVPPELFARWPEKPIEDVVGGVGMSGLGENGEAGYYPQNEYGYGIPKDFGAGPGLISVSDPANLQLLPPHDTEIPRADLQGDLKYIRAAKGKNPSMRIVRLKGQPDDHGPPYYRGNGKQPSVKVENQPYPPGSPWNKNLGRDVRKFWKSGPTVQEQEPGTPERQVRIVVEQPMSFRKRRTMVVTRARRLPSGMGDFNPVVNIDDPTPTPTTQAAGAAGKSVFESIMSTIGDIVKVAGKVVPPALVIRAQNAVSNATNRVAGSNIMTPGMAPSTPWYASPFVLLGGLLVVGGTAYALTRGGGRRRR